MSLERVELIKFKENYSKSEVEYTRFKTDYEITKKSLENLQDEMKKNREKNIQIENESKQKERKLADLTDKLKDYEIRLNLKEGQIQDLEMKALRGSQIVMDNDFSAEDLNNSVLKSTDDQNKGSEQQTAKQIEDMVYELNSLRQTIESQKLSHSDQINKMTEKIDGLRRENVAMKRENELLKGKVEEQKQLNSSPTHKKEQSIVFPKDENSIMTEMLQKTIELETSVRKFKIKSDELSQQLIQDREFYNSSLNIIYSIFVDKFLS